MAKLSIEEKGLDFFLKRLWASRASGEELPEIDIFHAITPENVAYLLTLYPFLQIISSEAEFEEEVDPKFINAKSGWVIHDYGEAMSTSLGDFLYSGGEYHPLPLAEKNTTSTADRKNQKKGEKSAKKPTTRQGTVINQAVDTATEMVDIAHKKKKWPGIHIVDGTPIMQWATWMIAEGYGLEVSGFEPSPEDYHKQSRIQTLTKDWKNMLEKQK